MSTGAEYIRGFCEPGRLAEGLRKACAAHTRHKTIVGILSASGNCRQSLLRWSDGIGTPEETGHRTLIGCVAKAFTASLVAQLSAEGAFSLNDPLDELLGVRGRWPALLGITVRHLLNHTHGLDASKLTYAPRSSDGFIDSTTLYRHVSDAYPLASPGEMYSYGQVGSWWAAALLERYRGQSYTDILTARLLEPLQIRPEFEPTFPPVCCPARGGGLRLSVADLLRLLQWQLGAHEHVPPLPGIPGEVVGLPGIGLERGSALGWLHYGEGWYGHTALLPGASICLRFHAEHKLALIVTTDSPSATLITARLFATALPEFRGFALPRPHAHWRPELAELRALEGDYRNASLAAVIRSDSPPVMELTITRPELLAGTDPRVTCSRLRACADNVFLLEPPVPGFGSWIQFVRPTPRGYGYLWNGKELMPCRTAKH